jgi:hypothetical protein
MSSALAVLLVAAAWLALLIYLGLVIAERHRQDRKKDSDQ